MIHLRTIPYSGTRFVADILRKAGLRPNVDFQQEHIDIHTYADLFSPDDCLIVTIRDPILCRISSCERGNPPSQYPVWLWRQVFRMENNPLVHFVFIDQPRVDECDRLAGFLGVDVRSDWEPVGAAGDRVASHVRREYERLGKVPENSQLEDDVAMLEQIGANDFFRWRGYSLPWMSTSGRTLRIANFY